MRKTVNATLLASLVPVHALREALREALLDYSEQRELKPEQTLSVDAARHAVWIVRGAVEVDHADGSPQMCHASITSHLQIADPHHGEVTLRSAAGATVVLADRNRLDTLLTWTQLYPDGERPDTWLLPVLRSEWLARLPGQNVQTLLRSASARSYAHDETIISQGEPGREYFLLVSGGCEVVRESESGVPLLIAELQAGDSFGEEALLTGQARNASIVASSDGASVLVIDEADFNTLVSQPLLNSIRREQLASAPGLVQELDVRTPEEFAASPAPGALNFPLAQLRDHLDRLSRDEAYATSCDTGRRAAAAAFLLAEAGFDVSVVRGSPAPHLSPGQPPPEQPQVLDVNAPTAELATAGTYPAAAAEPPPVDTPPVDTRAADTQAALEQTLDVFEQTLGEAAELQAHLAPESTGPGSTDPQALDPEATDPDLRERLEAAQAELETVQEERLRLERQLRDEHAQRERATAHLRAQREILHAQTEAIIQAEREHLAHLYAQAEQRVAALNQSRERIKREAGAELSRIEAALQEAETRLLDETAQVRQALAYEQAQIENRERTILEHKASQDAELVAESEATLRRERQRLEADLAASVDRLSEASARLQAAEREREAARERARHSAGQRRARVAQHREQVRESMQAGDEKAVSAALTEETLRLEAEEALSRALESEQEELDSNASLLAARYDAIAGETLAHQAEDLLDVEMMHDISAQLQNDTMDGPAAETGYAQAREALLHDAQVAGEEERQATQEALQRARAHLQRLRAPPDDEVPSSGSDSDS